MPELAEATDTEEARLRAKFDIIDADGSGAIDKAELGQLLEDLGKDVSEAQLGVFFGLADKDGSGAKLNGEHSKLPDRVC